jgi:HlyD family secretion protein
MAANTTKASYVRRKPVTLVAIGVLFVAAIIAALWLKAVWGASDPASKMATFTAKRGPLTIKVLVTGTIQAREQIILRNEVEGRTSIIRLVPEGTRVKAGDLLVELDASTLKDAIVDQDIQVQKTYAAFIDANETLAVAENQAKSDTEKAELTLRFAVQDLKHYTEGLFPNELKTADAQITLATEELARAEEKLRSSQKLYEAEYLSETELNADKLAKTKRELDLQLAISNRDVLKNFTYERNLAQYQSDANQAAMALERTKRKANADLVQAKADLSAKKAEYDRQEGKLAKFKDQLGKTRIIAPADGMVVYATTSGRRGPFDRREPMDIGVEVTERQDLISLPTADSMMAQVDIHETSLEKVRVGLPTVVTVDAVPGKKFLGRVGMIAPLPDARSMWANPDLKIYPTDVYLEDNDSSLRTGMSCMAEIVVAKYDDTVYVPVEAVLRVRGRPTVHIVSRGSIEQREVETGLDDNVNIRIISGLEEGEIVLMEPPLESGAIGPGSTTAEAGSEDTLGDSATMSERINQRLEEANGTQAGGPGMPSQTVAGPRQQGREGPATGGDSGRGPSAPDGSEGPSSNQAERIRQQFENMSPEERQKEMERMRQRFENMSPEERAATRQRFQGGGSGQGQGRRQREDTRTPRSERGQ